MHVACKDALRERGREGGGGTTCKGPGGGSIDGVDRPAKNRILCKPGRTGAQSRTCAQYVQMCAERARRRGRRRDKGAETAQVEWAGSEKEPSSPIA